MTELVKANANEPLPINGMHDLAQLGQFIAKSGMVGAQTDAQGMMIAVTCHQERLSILEFKRRYHVDGRGNVTMRSDRMLAEFHARGGTVEWIQWDHDACMGKWSYGINKNKEIGFTIQEAEKAGYIKAGSNWTKDPGSQLRARAISRAVRMLCPEAIAGVYAEEEMDDVYGPDVKPADASVVESVSIDGKEFQSVECSGHVAIGNREQFECPQEQYQPCGPAEQQQAQQQQQTQQQAPIVVQPQAVTPPFDQGPNFDLCPMEGTMAGKRWDSMDTNILQQAIRASHPAMQQGHYQAIQTELNKRGD